MTETYSYLDGECMFFLFIYNFLYIKAKFM